MLKIIRVCNKCGKTIGTPVSIIGDVEEEYRKQRQYGNPIYDDFCDECKK